MKKLNEEVVRVFITVVFDAECDGRLRSALSDTRKGENKDEKSETAMSFCL